MPEKRQTSPKRVRMNGIGFSAPPERSLSIREIQKEADELVARASWQRANRIAYYMTQSFPDIPDCSNAECEAYVRALRERAGEWPEAGREKPVPEEPVREDAGEAAEPQDGLADAMRAVFPDAPGPDADADTCTAFAEDLAGLRKKEMDRPASAFETLVRNAFPDLPADNLTDCEDYFGEIKESLRRLAWMRKEFDIILQSEPKSLDDAETVDQFHEALSGFLNANRGQLDAVLADLSDQGLNT